MKERLIHILDQSACLSRRQMVDYAAGTMIREEAYALEQHLNTCPLCSAAIDGMLMHPEAALEAVGTLNGDFLKTHFAAITPQIHLNSMTASVSATATNSNAQKGSRTFTPARLAASVAVLVALSLGATWYFTNRNTVKYSEHPLAVNTPTATQAPPEQAVAAAPAPATGKAKPAVAKAKADAKPNAPKNKGNSSAPPLVVTKADGENNKDAPKPTVAKAREQANSGGLSIGGGRTSGTKYVAGGADKLPSNNMADQQSVNQSVVSGNLKNEESAMPGTVSRNKNATLLPAPKAAANDKAAAPKDNLEAGDKLMAQNKYGSALTQYKKELNSTDKGRRQKATVKAAQCYANTGNKLKAKQMLQSLIDEGGPEKRAAKRLLKDIEKEEKWLINILKTLSFWQERNLPVLVIFVNRFLLRANDSLTNTH